MNDDIENKEEQSVILNKKKSIERLKQKHEKEMVTAIQNELRNEIFRRQNQKN